MVAHGHLAVARAALALQARRTAIHIVKQRARRYARCPFLMNALFPGLSAASPDAVLAIAIHLIEDDRADPRRWFSYGGETYAINLHALLIFGRTMRRQRLRTS